MSDRYLAAMDYAGAYSTLLFDTAGPHTWARLEDIASEYARGEYPWSEVVRLMDDTIREAGQDV